MISLSLKNASTRTPILTPLLCSLLIFSVTSCATRSRPLLSSEQASIAQNPTSSTSANTQRINLNTANAKELEVLPGIGKGLAERIVEHREKYGPFRRAEHLMMVRGISETRFRALRHLVTVEQ
ncbi:MAG TPA: ComEA family DNA-binding protein [Pyrinomonadaceae bacterium]|nr:ComEA family DNA-binding protein [Pyrinomonadaceae bacterium]